METAQSEYLAWLAKGKSDADKVAARAADRASHAELKELARLPENSTCADCSATRPGWAVLPWGAFVCIDCAQLHRHIGRHVSQVKAFNTGTYLWFEPELAVMRAGGNARVTDTLCGAADAPSRPSRDATAETKLAYVRGKYVERLWMAKVPSPTACAHHARAVAAEPRAVLKRHPPHEKAMTARPPTQDLLSTPLSQLPAPVLPFSTASSFSTAPKADTLCSALVRSTAVDVGAAAYGAKKLAVLAQFSENRKPQPQLQASPGQPPLHAFQAQREPHMPHQTPPHCIPPAARHAPTSNLALGTGPGSQPFALATANAGDAFFAAYGV
mmetsp:Transcript_18382/g.47347  ORF Transcript_18382/g.47347 Transcript_18382/m.47347 type:complete len:328 (+) Transcript_18382:84-1067(+)|eukprot:CAMPEP_0119414796 /NCGR_PEP_ID=MMETSP1335-20130426/7181_1 /TAXON_ID=259385 /ORGANISM="Chrysoculter rhomboideus, Strain RCC1486" /LENGTH=327 /DNA_ID=CAMNT_0007439687 /DNA_START=83 /DNA_END=1066 /DNA_ORIENTATION=-